MSDDVRSGVLWLMRRPAKLPSGTGFTSMSRRFASRNRQAQKAMAPSMRLHTALTSDTPRTSNDSTTTDNTIQYNTIQYNTVRCGAVRFGAVRCGSVRCGAVRCGAVRFGAVRCGSVRFGAVRCGRSSMAGHNKGIDQYQVDFQN